MKKQLLVLSFALLSFYTFAQDGPGGVGSRNGTSALKVWLDANDASTVTTSTGPVVTQWSDKSGNANHATNSSNYPSYIANQFNGNAAIYFNAGASNYLRNTSMASSAGSTPDVFMSLRVNSYSPNGIVFNHDNGYPNNAYMQGTYGAGSGFYNCINPGGTKLYTPNDKSLPIGQHSIVNVFFGLGLANQSILAIDGNYSTFDIPSGSYGTTTQLDKYVLGGYLPASMFQDFHTGEVIVFSTKQNNTQRYILENYLASKYAIGSIANDFYQGDTPANGNYDLAVIGVGQQGASDNHTIAHSDGGLNITVTSSVTTGAYLFAGHNKAVNSLTSSNLFGSVLTRWDRDFYLDKTGSLSAGNTKIAFNFLKSGLSTVLGLANTYTLLYRSTVTGTFTEVSVANTAIIGSEVVFDVADANIVDGYYTIGTKGAPSLTVQTNNALDFDGTNDNIRILDDNSLDFTTQYTFEAWIYVKNYAHSTLISKWDDDANNRGWMINFGESGGTDKLCVVHDNTGMYSNPISWNSTFTPALNTWYHIAVTFDANLASNEIKLYVNGNLFSQTSWAFNIYSSAANVYLGGYDNPSNGLNGGANARFFRGTMDDVRLWNTARTPTEILNNYQRELSGTEPGLVAYYPFNQGLAGLSNIGITSVTDKTTPAKNGSIVGMALTSTTSNFVASNTTIIGYNNALDFAGDNDYIDLGTMPGTNFTSDFTIETWMKWSGVGGWYGVISKENWNSSLGWLLHTDGNTVLFIKAGSGVGALAAISTPTNWNHIACTYKASTGTVEMFVNGVLVNSNTSVFFTASSEKVYIGSRHLNTGGGPTDFFPGQLDEVRFWNKVRTQAEIQNSYNQSLSGNESGLVAYYTFNQGIANGTNTGITQLNDIAGSTDNGIMNGFGLTSTSSNFVTGVVYPASTLLGTVTNYNAGTQPSSIAIGDLNGDGRQDLAITNNLSGTIGVFNNTGTGFAPQISSATGTNARILALGDLNNDGKTDLASVNQGNNTISVWINNGSNFAAKVDYSTGAGSTPYGIAMGDINNDGWLDIAVANQGNNTISVFTNTGNGFSTKVDYPTSGTAALAVAIGDINNDGKLDLAVTNYNSANVSILTNTGSGFGTASLVSAGSNPHGIAIGDINNDGRSDLVITNYGENTISVYTNTGSSLSTRINYATGSGPVRVAIGDLNGDGRPDLCAANYTGNTISIFTNTGSSFGSKIDFATGNGPEGVALGDLNGDGKLDIATANVSSNNVSVIYNAWSTVAPTFVSISNPVTVCGGSVITAQFVGNFLSYQWYKDGVSIAGANTSSYAPIFSGTYHVVATNIIGSVTSSIVTVTSSCNNALHFNGNASSGFIDNSISVTSNSDDFNLPNFTFEAWVNYTGSNTFNTILSKGNGNSNNNEYIFQIQGGSLMLFNGRAPSSSVWYSSGFVIPTNTWTHVAATYNSTTSILGFYVNGNLVNTQIAMNFLTPINAANNNFLIGIQGTNCQCNRFNGQIDELRIWNVARTPNDIRENIYRTINGNVSGLVAAYNFNQGIANGNNAGLTTLLDQNNGLHNGVLNSFTLNGTTSNWVGAVTTINGLYQFGAPFITMAPAVTVCSGATSSYTITASGQGSFSYQWFRNGVSLAGQTTATLTLTSALTSVTGTFTVQVSSIYGTSTSSGMNLGLGCNNALNFDGVGDVIVIPASPALSPQRFTLETWFWVNTPVGSNWRSLVANWTDSWTDGFGLYTPNNNPFTVGIGINTHSSPSAVSTTTFAGNTWYHIAATYDGSFIRLYINGVLNTSTSYTGPVNVSSNSFRLGGGVTNYFLNGRLDNTRLWDKALLPQEIVSAMNSDVSSTTTGLLFALDYNQGIAFGNNSNISQVNDISGNLRNASIVGISLNGSSSNFVTSDVTTTGFFIPIPATTIIGISPSQTVCSGLSIPLSVTATGSGLGYQWRKDGINISGATSSTLTLSGVTSTTAGIYSVIITSLGGNLTSSGISLGVGCNNALHFDQTNDFVRVSNPFTAFQKEITVESWIDFNSSNGVYWASQALPGSDNMTTNVWLISGSTGNNTFFYINDNQTWRQINITGTITNGWHHVAMVANANFMGIYLDGVLLSTTTGILTGIQNSPSAQMEIGHDIRYPASGFGSNRYDEFRVWNIALSKADIQANMNRTVVTSLTGLMASYNFNQGNPSGNNTGLTTLIDQSGNGRNGVLNNFTGLSGGSTSNWVSSATTISGNYAFVTPTITGITPSQTVCSGVTLPLSATVSGTVLAYQWRKDGINITGATTSSLTLSGVTSTSAGVYSLLITSLGGNLTSTGISLGVGCNNALNFDGVNDGVYVHSFGAINNLGANGFSCEAWINRSANSSALSIIRKTGDYDFYINANTLRIEVWPNGIGNSAWRQYVSTANVPSNTLTHVAVVYSNNVASFYINGVKETISSFSTSSIANISDLGIGISSVYGNPFQGSLDDLRLWNIALSDQDIQQNRNRAITTSLPGLALHFNFNQGLAGGNNAGLTTLIPTFGNNFGTLTGTFALNGATSNWVASSSVLTGNYSFAIPSIVGITTSQAPCGISTLPLSVTATGSGLTYQWRKDGVNIAGANQASYTISGFSTTSLGVYAVVISGTGGNITSSGIVISGCNNALAINGGDQIVFMPYDAGLDVGNSIDFTYEAWIKYTGNSSGYMGIVTRQGGGSFVQFSIVNDKIAGEVFDGGNMLGVGQGLTGTTFVNDGQWHHAAMVVTRATQNVKIYVDGNLEANVNGISVSNILAPGAGYHIGNERGGGNPMPGTMDEVRIWHVALSQQEIQNNRFKNLTGTIPGLVAYYDYNQGVSGGNNAGLTTLLDRSGNGRNATLTNFTLNGSTENWVSANGTTTTTGTFSFTSAAILGITTSQTVCSGITVPLSVTATGSSLGYQWRKNGVNIAGATASTLTLTGATATTTGIYSVVISSLGGNLTSAGINILVNASEINLKGNVTFNIASGDVTPAINDGTNYGVSTLNTPLENTFTIENLGGSVLNINNISISGANASNFSIVSAPITSVASGGSANFIVQFVSTTLGVKNANIIISNSDCDESVYTFAITANITTIGTALDFDGVNDYLTMPSNNAGAPLTQVTIETWINVPTISGYGNGFYDILRSNSGAPLLFAFQNDGTILSFGAGLSTYAELDVAINKVDYENQWVHVAITYDGSTKKMYRNGVLIGSAAATGNISSSSIFYIGSADAVPNEALKGKMDEFRVWNRALTQTEIQNYMMCNPLVSTPGLYARFDFNQGNAEGSNAGLTSVLDRSGNANNATAVNFALLGANSNWGISGIANNTCSNVADINLLGNGLSIASGASVPNTINGTAFGNVNIGSSITKSFTIESTGLANLNISSIQISGTNASEFLLVSNAASPITPGNNSTFSVQFIPSGGGTRMAVVSILSNDPNESPYVFTISGTSSQAAGAVNFAANGNVIQVNDDISLDPSNLTIECWVKFTKRSGYSFFLSKHNRDSWNEGYGLATNFDGKKFYFFTDGYYRGVVQSTTNIVEGQWYHVAGTFDGNQAKLYVNGVLEGTTNYTFALPNTTNILRIGGVGYSYYSLNGSVDEARVWNVVKSQSEIQASMDCQIPSNATGLVLNHQFNNGMVGANNAGVISSTDASGSGNNGTLVGFTLNGSTSNWVEAYIKEQCIPRPDINVKGNGINILTGSTNVSLADFTNFGSSVTGTSITRTYTIENLGSVTLNISAVQIIGLNTSDFIITANPASTVNAGGSTTFSVQFVNTIAGLREAIVRIINDDGNEGDYRFDIAGRGLEAGFNLAGNGEFTDNGSSLPSTTNGTNFTSTIVGLPITQTYTIYNYGTSTLGISLVTIIGSGDFTITVPPASTVLPGQSTTFTVTFTPTSPSQQNAIVQIVNSQGTFEFAITGGGNIGSALAMNGNFQNQSVRIPHNPKLNIGGAITIETWLYLNRLGDNGGFMNILMKGEYGYGLAIGDDSRLEWWNQFSGGAGPNSNDPMPEKTWTHVAVTVNTITGLTKFYINGVLNSTTSDAVINNNIQDLMLGVQGTGCFCNFLDGALDELRIWNVERTQSQIQANMNMQIPGTVPGLVAYYQFNQGIPSGNNSSVTRMVDAGPNGLDGTLQNFVLNGSLSNWVNGQINTISPQVAISGASNLVTKNNSPVASNNTYFGTQAVGGVIPKIFTLQNVGNTTLGINFVTIVGSNPQDFVVASSPSTTLALGATSNFTINFVPTVIGVRNAVVRIASNDVNDPFYDFNVSALGLNPGFNVIGNGNYVSNGASTPITFNGTDLEGASLGVLKTQTFTIENLGITTLSISLVSITGSNEFTVVSNPASTVNASGTTTFSIGFTPSSLGQKFAAVSIVNSEGVFTYTISGTGQISSALSFDGNQSVLIPDNNALDFTNKYTFEAWINLSAYQYGTIVSKYDDDANNRAWFVNFGESGNNKRLSILHSLGNFSNFVFFNTNFLADLNTWYHIAVVYDGTLGSNQIKLYVNGALQDQTNCTFTLEPNNPANVYLGGYDSNGNGLNGGANSRFFKGKMDEVRFWNIARTAGEIAANYNSTFINTVSGLVAYYKFNQGIINGNNQIVTTLVDASGNRLDGTLANFALSQNSTSNWTSGVIDGIAPQVRVSGNGIVIPRNSAPTLTTNTNFGGVALGTPTLKTFTISNIGNTLLGISSVNISGPNAAEFTVSVTPLSNVSVAGTTDFTIDFSPLAGGVRNAIVNIATNDPDDAIYSFSVTGSVSVPGGALNFDGVDDYLHTGNEMPIHDEFTVETWINRTNLNNNQYIFGKNTSIGHAYSLQIINGVLVGKVVDTDNTVFTATGTGVGSGAWQHIAMTYRKGVDLKLYQMGNIDAIVPVSNKSIRSNAATAIIIGSQPDDVFGPNKFSGSMDEFHYWNRTLSQAEIQSRLSCQINSTTAVGLLINYDFNQGASEGNNTSINDVINRVGGGNFDATLLNGFARTGTGSNFVQGYPLINSLCGTFLFTDLRVKKGGIEVRDNQLTASTIDGTDFGIQNGDLLEETFILENNGFQTVTISSVSFSNSAFTHTLSSNIIAPNASATLTIGKLFSVAPGSYTSSVIINSNDNLAPAYDFVITANLTSPGMALDFDGTNDYVTIPYTSGMPVGNQDFSIETWLNYKGGQTGHRWFLTLGTNMSAQMIVIGVDADVNKIRVHSLNGNDALTSVDVIPNSWSHYAFIYRAASQTIEIFMNGSSVPVETLNFPIPFNFLSNGNITLGSYEGNYATFAANITLDEVRIWNRALLQSEILSRTSCQMTNTIIGIAAHYDFNQYLANGNNAGNTQLLDRSGNGKNGTLNNFLLSSTGSNWVPAMANYFSGTCQQVSSGTFTITGNGNLIANNSTITSSINGTDFGYRTMNQSVVKTFRIVNGNESIEISEIQTHDGFETDLNLPITINANQTFDFEISFTGFNICEINDFIYIRTNSVIIPEYSIPVSGYTDYDDFVVSGNKTICGTGTYTHIVSVSGSQFVKPDPNKPEIFPVRYTLYNQDHELVSGPVTFSGTDPFTFTTQVITTTSSFYVVADLTYVDNDITCLKTLSGMATVIVNPLPTINANVSPSTICVGESATFTGSGGISYSWTGGIMNGVASFPTVSGLYTVTGTDANGCTGFNAKNIVVNALPLNTIKATSVLQVCSGQQATISADEPNTSWTDGVINGTGFFPTVTGTYFGTMTGANGCKNFGTATVTVLSPPVLSTISGNTIYGQPYAQLLSTSLGLSYTLAGGNMPAGITISANSLTGLASLVTGVPDIFTIVGGNGSCETTGSYSILVNKADLTLGVVDTTIFQFQTIPAQLRVTATGFAFNDALSITRYGVSGTNSSTLGQFAVNSMFLAGSQLNNYNVTTVAGTLTIRSLTGISIMGRSISKPYAVPAPILTGIYFVDGVSVSGVTLAGTNTITINGVTETITTSFTSNVTSLMGVITNNIFIDPSSVTISNSYKYNLSTLTGGRMTITPLRLNVKADDKVWLEGQPAPQLTGQISSLVTINGVSGVVPGDSVFINFDYDFDGGVDTLKANYSVPYTVVPEATGNDLANYTLVMSTGRVRRLIGVTVRALDFSKVYGTPTPNVLKAYTITGVPTSVTSTMNFNNQLMSNLSELTVGGYNIIPFYSNGVDFDKYFIITVAGTLTVNPAGLTVTATNFTRVQGQPNLYVAPQIIGLVLNETVSVTYDYAGADENSPVGSYVITPSVTGAALANYTLTTIAGTLTIGAAPGNLNITANSFQREYGEPNPTLTGNITGLVNGDNVVVTYSTSATPNSPADASYPIIIQVSGNDLGKYIVNTVAGTLTITRAPLTVKANPLTTTYGESPLSSLSGVKIGLKNGEDVPVVYGTIPPTFSTSNANKYPIVPTVTGSILDNYSVTIIPDTLTINKRELTVLGVDLEKVYKTPNPPLSFNLVGFENGENIRDIYAVPVGTTLADLNSPVGIYDITFDGGLDTNYSFNYASSTSKLTINKATQTITVSSVNAKVKTGESITLSAEASSGLPLTVTVADPSILSANGLVINGLVDGISSVSISQLGDDNYEPAANVTVNVVSTSTGVLSVFSFVLAGTDTAYAGTSELSFTYANKPGVTYQWKYTGTDVSRDDQTTPNFYKIGFGNNATSGYVIGTVLDENGNIIKRDSMFVTVIRFTAADLAANPELAEKLAAAELVKQLVKLDCEPVATDCQNAYILSFNLGRKLSNNSKCTNGGYGDFTTIGKIDSLIMGNSYPMRVGSRNTVSNANYFAIWIDYGNDGSFEDPDDFINASFSADSVFEMKNVVIRNNDAYIGPRRVRIGMRTSGAFVKTESCPSEGTIGETEDYLIYIRKQDALQAPSFISPNNDGKNDLFIVRGINTKLPSKLVIVDRNGELKFERNSYTDPVNNKLFAFDNDWAGTDNSGKDLENGTYYYFFTNGDNVIKGYVEINRK
jgi:hypothetical protein